MDPMKFLKYCYRPFKWISLSWKWNLLISLCLALPIIWFYSARSREIVAKHPICYGSTFATDYNFLVPAELGVEHWQIGDYARYRRYIVDTDGELSVAKSLVEFQVIAQLGESDSSRYWLRSKGTRFYREIPQDLYQLGTVSDLRMSSHNRGYRFTQNHLPVILKCDQTSVSLAKLVKVRSEKVETESGEFQCVHYRGALMDPATYEERSIEIWANPTVRPLGIVRFRSDTELLELVSFGVETDIIIPQLIEPVIQGISKLEVSCTSCHGRTCRESIYPPK